MSDITQSQKTALLKIPGFKEIQKQYAKESKMTGAGKKRRMKGRGGFWEDVGNWFDQAGKDVNQFLKDTKIVSNIAAYALPILGAMGGALLTVNPLGAAAGSVVGKSTADYIRSQGYGATHIMPDGKGKMHGSGYVNNLSKIGTKRTSGKGVKDFVKKHKLVSRGLEGLASIVPQGSDALNTQGAKNTLYRFANAAKMAGYGTEMMGNMMGKGPIYSQNGMLVAQPRQSGGCGCGMKGGATTQYNTVSTEFSEVKFR